VQWCKEIQRVKANAKDGNASNSQDLLKQNSHSLFLVWLFVLRILY